MNGEGAARPQVVDPDGEAIWFLGTYTRVKLDGAQTGGRFGVFETVFPRGAAPPLHSHPQDETFYVLDGELTAWLVEDPDSDWAAAGRRCSSGSVLYASAGTPHTFRVESETARVLGISTPAGIEDFARALSEPARWPWLPAPADGPRVPPDRMAEVEREHGMVRHGPSPPGA